MTTDYNQIANQYRKAKEQLWRSRIEEFSLMNLAGDLFGKKVLDVACGEGFFTRKLCAAGADAVVGIDISEQMIALARAQETKQPLGIEYFVEDARARGSQQDYDLAVAAWLLVYAHTREELGVMCRGLARRVRPGGRFATLTTNPDLYCFPVPDYRKYGFEVRLADRVFEGAPITWTIYLDDSSFEIENYYLPASAIRSALEDAGFRDVAFHRLTLSPHPQGEDEGDFWNDFLDYQPAVMVDAVRE